MDEKITEYLRLYCTGEARAVTSRILERTFDLRGVEIREAVNRQRCEGAPLCSCATGYFYAETEEEINRCIRQLLSRCQKIAAAARGMMKSLPGYREDGQMSMDLFPTAAGGDDDS